MGFVNGAKLSMSNGRLPVELRKMVLMDNLRRAVEEHWSAMNDAPIRPTEEQSKNINRLWARCLKARDEYLAAGGRLD